MSRSGALSLAAFAPLGTVIHHPVGQRLLKANIRAGLLGLQPLVPEDFLALRQKFPIKRGIFQQITGCARFRHKRVPMGRVAYTNPSWKTIHY